MRARIDAKVNSLVDAVVENQIAHERLLALPVI